VHETRVGRRYAILEAPSILGLRPTGVERLPERLLELGFAERIAARLAGRIAPPPYRPGVDPATGVANAHAIAAWCPILATAIEGVIETGEVPVILGGDCSILLGSMLALRRRGRFGLLFLDGHADYFQPAADPNGEAASMDLGFVTGVGPPLLTDLEGRRPLVRSEDTVAMAFRDADEQVRLGSQPLPPELRAYDLASVRRLGARVVAEAAIDHLTRAGLGGFFVHIDADCLDDDIMPAVDYRTPGGLSWEEFRTILDVALASGQVVGLEVTIYNPNLDADGTAGQGLTDALVATLGSR
jgi:arginase